MHAAHDATHETVQRHEDVPRPNLIESVDEVLDDEADQLDETANSVSLSELREQTFYTDAKPTDLGMLNEDIEGLESFIATVSDGDVRGDRAPR